MRRFPAFLLILVCPASTAAAPHPGELTKKFVGAWRLLSIDGIPPGRTGVYDRPKSSKIGLDFPLSAGILDPIGNSNWGAGVLLPLFFFWGCISAPSLSAQQSEPPLESIIYELPILQVPSFDIHTCNGGVGGPSLQKLDPHIPYPLSFHTLAHSFALICTFLHSPKMQPFSFQTIAHSLTKKNGGVGYRS